MKFSKSEKSRRNSYFLFLCLVKPFLKVQVFEREPPSNGLVICGTFSSSYLDFSFKLCFFQVASKSVIHGDLILSRCFLSQHIKTGSFCSKRNTKTGKFCSDMVGFENLSWCRPRNKEFLSFCFNHMKLHLLKEKLKHIILTEHFFLKHRKLLYEEKKSNKKFLLLFSFSFCFLAKIRTLRSSEQKRTLLKVKTYI